MTKAQERAIKNIWARTFEKHISVAHPDNGDAFFHEISRRDFHVSNAMNISLIYVLS
jgi:hypothetical protein